MIYKTITEIVEIAKEAIMGRDCPVMFVAYSIQDEDDAREENDGTDSANQDVLQCNVIFPWKGKARDTGCLVIAFITVTNSVAIFSCTTSSYHFGVGKGDYFD